MTTNQGASPTSGDTTEPAQAVELYLETRSDDVTETTLRSHRYRLNHFIRWCEDVRGIKDLSTLTGQRLHEYRLWRREDGDSTSSHSTRSWPPYGCSSSSVSPSLSSPRASTSR